MMTQVQYGRLRQVEPQPEQSIPEPESTLTMGIGLACLIAFRFFARRLNPSK